MDPAKILLVWVPIFLVCSDIVYLFSPPPPNPTTPLHHLPKSHPLPPQPLEFPSRKTSGIGGIGIGNTININFCSSCSYRGNAINTKNMLETTFPGVDIILANHPPPLPKRLLNKVVPVFQMGFMGIIMAGEQIFPRLGIMTPPSWYYSLRANRFGSIASVWLMGNFFQSLLQNSGAFEVYCNGELVFSKLKEHRFPGEIELRDLIRKKLANTRVVDGFGGAPWS